MTERRNLGRVLITGAAGFVGEALVHTLRADSVTVIASDVKANDDSCLAPCDLTDSGAVANLVVESAPDTIIHCGAVSGPMVMADRPLDIWRINSLGTAHVLEAALRQGVERTIVCSTTEVYGCRNKGMVDEETRPEPDTVYGASKLAAEQAVIGYRREHGLDAAAIRLSWVYGPGRRTPTDLERILKNGMSGRTTVLGGRPDDVTHYFFLNDAVRGLICAAATRSLAFPIYNITAGNGGTLEGAIDAIRAVLPDLEVKFGDREPRATGPLSFDGTRSAISLLFRPKIDLITGIRMTVDALALIKSAF